MSLHLPDHRYQQAVVCCLIEPCELSHFIQVRFAKSSFIDPQIIAAAPAQYFWAGMGDTMAKHVESVFSSKNDVLDFESSYGVTISKLCYEPILERARKPMRM